MTNESLFRAIGEVSDDKVAEADAPHMVKRNPRPRSLLIAAAVLIAIATTTAFTFGDKILEFFEVMPIAQTPVSGYTNVDNNSELLSVQHEFDGERGSLEFYVSTYDLEESDGNYTLREVALGNARLILLKPKDSNGFFLKEGEVICLYALLDLTPDYADENGQTVQVGYSLDDVLYESFRGTLVGGGMTFEITAPRDGEFVIFLINASLEIQNYTELTINVFNMGGCI